MNDDRCAFSRCAGEPALVYLGRPICDRHWDSWAERPSDELKRKLGIKVELKAEERVAPPPPEPEPDPPLREVQAHDGRVPW